MTATAAQISQISVALASCDTVDGYSLLGTSGLDTIDVNGDPIAPGVEVINFYDSSGEYLNSCEKEGPDGWAELGVAGADTVDINGNPIPPGTEVIDFYDADSVYVASCEKAASDGYAVQGIADADTVDANGAPIAVDEQVIHFYDGDGNYINSCLKEGPDGYSEQGVADAATVDSTGSAIPVGTPVVHFYDADGEYVNSCVKAGPDGYSEQSVSSATTVDSNGNPIAPDQDVIDFYNSAGVYVNSCLKSGPDGYAEQDVAGTDTVNLAGDPILPGVEVINFYDENGDYINSCAKGPKALDCDGDVIIDNYSPLTVEQGHAPVIYSGIAGLGATADCKPALPDCDVVGLRTHTQNNYGTIEWEWNGSDWVDVNFSPWADEVSYMGSNTAVASDTNGILAAALNNEQPFGDPINRTITNNDCYCWSYRAEVSAVANFISFSNNNQANITLASTANDTTPGAWVTTSREAILDTTQWDGETVGVYDIKDYLHAFNIGTIQPGQTVTFEHQALIVLNQYTDGNAQNQQAQARGLGGRIQLWRKPC